MKIYFHKLSGPSRLVEVVSKVIGLEPEYSIVDLRTGKQYEEEYARLNLKSKVPVLVDTDGFVLSESYAIVKYLCDKNNKTDLYPSATESPKDRAIVDQYLSILNDARHNGVKYITGMLSAKQGKVLPEPAMKSYIDSFEKIVNEFNTYLTLENGEVRQYAVLDRLTLVDLALFTTSLHLFNFFQHGYAEKYPNYLKFVGSLKERHPVLSSIESDFAEFIKAFMSQ